MAATSLIFVIVFCLHKSLSLSPCCPTGENFLVGRKCADGSNINALSCPSKYLTRKEPGMDLDQDGNLLIATSKIPPGKFCASRTNDTDIYLVCFGEEAYWEYSVFTVYAVLELISVLFLLLTVYVYLQVSELLDLQGVCILHSISGLAVSFLALASNQLTTYRLETHFCVTLAYVIYFTMLYSFFWLNVLAFHIWRTTVKPKLFDLNRRHWLYIYHVFGCGGPIILLVILKVAHSMRPSEMNPGFGETKCWFKSGKSQFVYFYGPMAILLALNILYYGWTIATLWRHLIQDDQKKTKVLKYRFLLCVKLFFIMGISWIFELLSAAFHDVSPTLTVIWYVTDALNTVQGILIFLILVVFRKRVVKGLADRNFCGIRLPARWRSAADDECEEFEEELNLSETQIPKN